MFKKIKIVILAQLTQGVSPHSLALSCALAFVLGTFPIFGATTVIVFFVALYLRLNQPIMQVLNYSLTPVHLILLPIFLRIGEWIVGAPPIPLHPKIMMEQFSSDWRLFLTDYGMAGVHAALAWVLIAPLLGVLIFYSLRPVFMRIQKRYARN